jgi:uncharacterized membrane protein (DUF2068 family)
MAKSHKTLRVIAVFKFAKATALLAVAGISFGLVHGPNYDKVAAWIQRLHLESGRFIIARSAEKLLSLQPKKLILIGVVATIYGLVFALEGYGLWTRKKWGEWLTVIITGSLIPFEIWELVHHFSPLKLGGLALNVAIVIYLWRVARAK